MYHMKPPMARNRMALGRMTVSRRLLDDDGVTLIGSFY